MLDSGRTLTDNLLSGGDEQSINIATSQEMRSLDNYDVDSDNDGELMNQRMRSYKTVLVVIALMYLVPSVQVVAMVVNYNQQVQPQHHTHTDNKTAAVHDNFACHYNWKCKRDWVGESGRLVVPAVNHLLSNLGYILGGAYLLIRFEFTDKRRAFMGVWKSMSLFKALATAIILEGVFSSLFHLCPCTLNFQFDSTFMFFISGLVLLLLYHKRHGRFMLEPVRFYFIIVVFFAMNTTDILLKSTNPDPQSPASRTVRSLLGILLALMVSSLSLIGTTNVYYHSIGTGQLDNQAAFGCQSIMACYHVVRYLIGRCLTSRERAVRDPPKFWFLALVNVINLGVTIGALFTSIELFDLILGGLILNINWYVLFYTGMKLRCGEHIPYECRLYGVLLPAVCVAAVYCYANTPFNSTMTMADSNKLNQECVLLGVFDMHDLWHFLSALGLTLTVLFLYTIDMPLSNTPAAQIQQF